MTIASLSNVMYSSFTAIGTCYLHIIIIYTNIYSVCNTVNISSILHVWLWSKRWRMLLLSQVKPDTLTRDGCCSRVKYEYLSYLPFLAYWFQQLFSLINMVLYSGSSREIQRGLPLYSFQIKIFFFAFHVSLLHVVPSCPVFSFTRSPFLFLLFFLHALSPSYNSAPSIHHYLAGGW